MEKTTIAVRALVNSKTTSSSNYRNQIKTPNFTRTITIDTETTVNQYQNLLFGYYRIDDNYQTVDAGFFYNPKLVTKKELKTIKNISKKIIPVQKFIDSIFLPEVYDRQTQCIGFNLPFDLSRLAIQFGFGRKSNRDAFSFKLTENKAYPRLIIKNLDSTKSFIRWGSSSFKKYQYTGNFLDLRTLTFSLSSKKHTLESACEFFHSSISKQSTTKHGKITPRYVKYNQNDANATFDLYKTLLDEYENYNLVTPVTKIYSPASIGKSLLDEMGILPFNQISEISLSDLGHLMTTYFGGRTDVRIRKQPTPVKYLDFLSMYPTVCALQNLWSFVIAEKVIQEDCTKWAIEFLEKINLDDLKNSDAWKKFPVMICIKPDNDILPARAKYGNKYAYNIGINNISYDGNLWYCLADIIASKLLTGKTPKIIQAIRFIPNGIQKNLKPITILNETIDPRKEDFFKKIIEKRQKFKDKKDPKEQILKIIANATSYGIYAQINTQQQKSEVDVYGLEQFTTKVDKIEKLGDRFNPILSTFITSGSRLILAIVESILAKHDATYAFCDTDSMAVPSEFVGIIQNYFQKLNPYNFEKPLFKLEEENFKDGKDADLWFYGISSKRYVLYNIIDGKFVIRKHSSHGLGHINNPFSKEKDWEKELWLDILKYHYNKISLEKINEKYSNHYAVSQLTISTPYLLRRFQKINKKKSHEEKIKPFNFCMVGFGNSENVKPLSAYRKNSQEVVFDEFIDYNSGRIMYGTHYWKNLNQIFWEYLDHLESKFDGNIGILKRKDLRIIDVVTIGKESNDIEESEILGLDDRSYLVYSKTLIDQKKILSLTVKEARRAKISKNQLYRIQNSIKNQKFNPNKKTIEKLRLIIQ